METKQKNSDVSVGCPSFLSSLFPACLTQIELVRDPEAWFPGHHRSCFVHLTAKTKDFKTKQKAMG